MKNTIIFKLLALILLFTACNDFFEPDPRSKYSIMDAWKSEHNTNLYINGFYKPIYEYGPYGRTYAGVGMSDGLTDILKYNSSGMNSYGGDMNKVVFKGVISPDGNLLENYDYIYARIRRINEFLYNIDIYPKYGDEFKNRAKAQARFFRAFLYTMLIRNHGKIVLRTQLDGPKEANKPLSPEKECWDFVEEDLDFAAKYLPKEWESKDDLGRLTKGAVYGFKSRAMLYAERWQKAVDAANEVIKMEGDSYGLMENYADAFIVEDNKECVLGFRFGGVITQNFNRWYAPPGDSEKLTPVAIASPTQEMVDSYRMADGSRFSWENPVHAANPYENREPRFYASILYNGAQWKGRTIETFVGGKDGYKKFGVELNPNTTTTGYYIRKLMDEKLLNLEQKSTMFWSEVRYAEVLLNHAEAAAELDNVAEALVSLNKVRARAKLPEVTVSNKADVIEIIREERKVELAFEGHRYWDLRRWRLAVKVLKGKRMKGIKIIQNADSTFTYNVVDADNMDRYFEERYYHFPIPNQELETNSDATQIENW